MNAPLLAQVTGGFLEEQPGNVQAAAAGVGALLAAAAAHYSANARNLSGAGLLFGVGLAVAVVTGFALGGVTVALFGASVFFLVGAAWAIYVYGRASIEVGLWGIVALLGIAGIGVLADAKTAAFAGAATLSVVAALRVLNTDVLVHATVWLAAVLFGVAGIYLSLGAEFLAIVQVLIYVGAVVTLFLFTVMLTIPEEEVHGLDEVDLPPGVVIESVRDLEPGSPRYGVGPYKGFQDTNPRKPVRSPPTLYGVAIADGVYGDETTEKRKGKKKEV